MMTIIDYGVGNINAFVNVYKRVDVPVSIARSREDLLGASKIILPGVGHFDHAMKRLNDSGMRGSLDELVLEQNVPVVGICVGMQLMAHHSEEGNMEGLKWIDATVRKFDETSMHYDTRLPHMGWNDVEPTIESPLFLGLEREAIFYFLHSYYFECHHQDDIAATTEYGNTFTSVANHKNRYGVQFHPEKSHHYGEILLHNFAKL